MPRRPRTREETEREMERRKVKRYIKTQNKINTPIVSEINPCFITFHSKTNVRGRPPIPQVPRYLKPKGYKPYKTLFLISKS
jgi:hypothetical protein